MASTSAPEASKPSAVGTVNIDAEIPDIYNQLPPLNDPLPARHKDFIHCLPPHEPTYRKYAVFTAGSIEMGKAIQWQQHLAKCLQHLPITVCNPRRGEWNPTISPLEGDKEFRTQVEWELQALENVDVICFFFDTNTQSPVTMLELGLWASSGKVVVCCDEKFWKAGNVHIVCQRYGIPYVKSFADLVPKIVEMLEKKGMRTNEDGDLVNDKKKLIPNNRTERGSFLGQFRK